MEQKPVGLVPKNESPLHVNLLATATTPRLTPTGKISHAKTRVYTQRYRKEWEEMPEFKGWLTSVPFQPTRAYCMYCKKNLHAHRLSLLKHTCTMKHQRAAEMHKAECKKNMGYRKTEPEDELEVDEGGEVVYAIPDHSKMEGEDNDDETEYVVERLEMDDDEMDVKDHIKQDLTTEEVEEEEEEEEDDDMHTRLVAEDEDVKHFNKKIKFSPEGCRDTLAEAMAHVHGEYLEDTDDQGNVQVEMVVEADDQNNPDMQVMTILPDIEDEKPMIRDSRENGRSIRREIKVEKKMSSRLSDDSKSQNDSGIVMACTVPVIGTTYNLSSSVVPTSGTIGVLQPINTLPIAPAQTKTITLTTGKTLTLTGGSFQPGGQYVLRKLKGSKLPTLVMAQKKTEGEHTIDTPKMVTVTKASREQMAVAGTSRQLINKHVGLKPLIPSLKKPRISTHVVDTSKGLPVGGLQVSLYKLMDGRWTFLNESNTSANGRCTDLIDNAKVTFTAGRYKMHFDVDKYFTLRRIETMYPFIEIVFDVKNPAGNYHIPVLLSPFGYTTYRGSER